MAKKRYNLCVPKPGANDKTYWLKIGSLWLDGEKISVKLDSIPAGMVKGQNGPVPWEGWINAFPDEDRSQSSGYKGGGSKGGSGSYLDNDDEIPF